MWGHFADGGRVITKLLGRPHNPANRLMEEGKAFVKVIIRVRPNNLSIMNRRRRRTEVIELKGQARQP